MRSAVSSEPVDNSNAHGGCSRRTINLPPIEPPHASPRGHIDSMKTREIMYFAKKAIDEEMQANAGVDKENFVEGQGLEMLFQETRREIVDAADAAGQPLPSGWAVNRAKEAVDAAIQREFKALVEIRFQGPFLALGRAAPKRVLRAAKHHFDTGNYQGVSNVFGRYGVRW